MAEITTTTDERIAKALESIAESLKPIAIKAKLSCYRPRFIDSRIVGDETEQEWLNSLSTAIHKWEKVEHTVRNNHQKKL